jgi:hypothetical protein
MTRTALAILLAATGCRTAGMAVDPRLAASSDEYAVSGRKLNGWSTPLAFGPWRTGPVSDGATRSWSLDLLVYSFTESHRPYAFGLEGPGGVLEAECHERRHESVTLGVATVDERAAKGLPVLACAFRVAGTSDAGRAWTLALRSRDDGGFEGELREPGGGAAYTVRSIHALEGTALGLPAPAGFTFERGGGPAAAVEVINSGRVFLPRGAPEVPALAAAAASLLLFQPEPVSK